MSRGDINKQFFSFLGKLCFVTLFMIIMFVAVLYLFPDINMPSKSVAIFIVVFAVTAGVHYILLKSGQGERNKLTNLILLSSVIKLFIYAIFTFLLILSDRQGAMANVVLFFIAYIILTVFEISTIYSQVNRT
jgi:hypothetical protein